MEAYTGFAEVYDMFMDNVPYEEWNTYLTGLLKEYGIEDGLVLELGCSYNIITHAFFLSLLLSYKYAHCLPEYRHG